MRTAEITAGRGERGREGTGPSSGKEVDEKYPTCEYAEHAIRERRRVRNDARPSRYHECCCRCSFVDAHLRFLRFLPRRRERCAHEATVRTTYSLLRSTTDGYASRYPRPKTRVDFAVKSEIRARSILRNGSGSHFVRRGLFPDYVSANSIHTLEVISCESIDSPRTVSGRNFRGYVGGICFSSALSFLPSASSLHDFVSPRHSFSRKEIASY